MLDGAGAGNENATMCSVLPSTRYPIGTSTASFCAVLVQLAANWFYTETFIGSLLASYVHSKLKEKGYAARSGIIAN